MVESKTKKKSIWKHYLCVGLIAICLGAVMFFPQIAKAVETAYCSWDEERIAAIKSEISSLQTNVATEEDRLDRIESAFNTPVDLTTTYSLGSNWSSGSASAVLVGNELHVYFSATRSSATSSGDIGNQTVMNITINHGGKIKDLCYIAFPSGGTGPAASFQISGVTNSSTSSTFTITLGSTYSALTSTNSYFVTPVVLNFDNY